MGQTVSDIMTKDLIALSAEHSVRDAARRMREANVGAIVVQKHGDLFGIVTDRDIVVRCLARGGDCDETSLADICSSEVITLRPDDEVDMAVALMRDRAIRRVPVVANGKAVGILSLGDLALERDPFSALGAISNAHPNNERPAPASSVANALPMGAVPKASVPKVAAAKVVASKSVAPQSYSRQRAS